MPKGEEVSAAGSAAFGSGGDVPLNGGVRTATVAERLDAATAAFQVGYESPSQFSREYSRLFGAPPLRDVASLRQLAPGMGA